jgi:hypothetical protein
MTARQEALRTKRGGHNHESIAVEAKADAKGGHWTNRKKEVVEDTPSPGLGEKPAKQNGRGGQIEPAPKHRGG